MSRLRRNSLLLTALLGRGWRRIIERASPDLLLTIADIIYNVKRGVLPLNPRQRRTVHKSGLLRAVLPRTPPERIRMHIYKRGTPALFKALISPAIDYDNVKVLRLPSRATRT